jgi:hypothetical protein
MRLKILLIITVLFNPLSKDAFSQSLIHYWNFNNSASQTTLLTPSVGTGSLTHAAGSGSGVVATSSNTTGQGFEDVNDNARNGDAAGAHLRVNNPLDGTLLFSLPVAGYKDVVVKYETRRSGQGAGIQKIDYSVNGTDFIFLKNVLPADGNPELATLDFSTLTTVNDNPDFLVRITFQQGAGGTGGNNRFDNFTVEGNTLGADVTAPVALFTPANASVNVAVSVQPNLTFNEDIRLVDNTPLSNANVASVLELRKTNASGEAVAFSATIEGRVVTVVPTTDLEHGQQYYLALKANAIEDLSDNAITEVASVIFTTIGVQTIFQPGDILPVAYRMNTSEGVDEVALLTLVDILPGTMIQFTDAKYTDNAQAQCAGGFTWIAPAEGVAAGTVLVFQNDVPSVNIGSVSGAGFGFSSSGDQLLVYTGTAAAPSYITALSSNAWVSGAHTACGGSISKLPAALAEGTSALSLSTAPDAVSGNLVNAYYNGTHAGNAALLRTSILNPANWVGTASGTAAQTWPAWSFPGAPLVLGSKVINPTTIQLIFNHDMEPSSVAELTNYTGIAGLSIVSMTSNGSLADTITLTYANPFASTHTLSVAGVKNAEGKTMQGTYTFTFTYQTKISFEKKFISVSENETAATVVLLVENPSTASVDLVLKPASFGTASAADFTFATQTISLEANSGAQLEITIPVVDDTEEEQDEYFVLALENASGCTIEGNAVLTVYIKDNDRKAPVPTKEIELSYVTSFDPSGAGASTTEIVVYDPLSQRLFITSGVQGRLDIADFSNPAAISLISSVDMTPYGGVTSVAVHSGIVAVASPNADEQQNGSVVFFDTDGVFQNQVTVGALPDMLTFTPDGKKVLVANEGQPNDAYTVDPEGSVSIIDLTGGVATLSQSDVTTLDFVAYNTQESSLIAAGVRKLKAGATMAQDLEPEYITVAEDSKKAWVSLQENNAIAEIDLETNTFSDIWALGSKDYSAYGNGFDASDNSGVVHLTNWPVKAFYTPDGIASYTVGGTTYLVTANEGDEKDFGGFSERTTVGAVSLDPLAFPNAAILKEEHNLGRLRISKLHGDVDNDGDYDELYVMGARSFSIFNTATKSVVYDSGDDFELYTSTEPSIASIFNADNESNKFKGRSRAKGPEPEGVTVASIGSEVYAFVGLERVGGVMVYNITNPEQAFLVDYNNNRSTTTFSGDHGPEGLVYIDPAHTADGKGYVVVANEISGTLTIYEVLVNGTSTGVDKPFYDLATRFVVYPNPSNGNEVYFTKKATVEVFDGMGVSVKKAIDVEKLELGGLAKGMYLIRTSEGEIQKLLIE